MKFKRVLCMGMAAVLACSNLPQTTVLAHQIQEEAILNQSLGLETEDINEAALSQGIEGHWHGNFKYKEQEDGTLSIIRYYCAGDDTKKVTIPAKIKGKKVTSIGDGAFEGCSSLSSIKIPEGITSIEGSPFSGCSSLKTINIPAGVTSINSNAFYVCSNLKEIVVNKKNKTYASLNGILYNKDKTELIRCPEGKAGKAAIPKGVTKIGSNAFWNCSCLSSIHIPVGVTSIENSAFYGSSNLKEIVVNKKNSAFVSQDGILYNKDKTELILCPSGKTGKITIPSEVIKTGTYAFQNCSNLEEIAVNKKNKTYASLNGILYNKDKTELILCPEGKTGKVTIPKEVKNITGFSGCSRLSAVTIPKGAAVISPYAFDGCSSLSRISIPAKVEYIGIAAFRGCSNLEEIVVNKKSKTYVSQDGILYNKDKTELVCCPARKTGKVIIPAEVTSIGHFAFYGCSSLRAISIPAGLTEIKSIGFPPFCRCSRLKEIIVNKKNKTYASQDGILYNKDKTTLIRCPEGKTGKVTIPKKVKEIGYFAFDNSHLSTVSIPKGVTLISGVAFANCSSDLTLVVVPDSYAETYAKDENLNYHYKKCTHTYKRKVTPATTKKNGSIAQVCSKCGAKKGKATIIYAAKNIKLSKKSFPYNNKVQKPSVMVKDSKGKALQKNKDYTVTYPKNPKNVGTYTVTIQLKGNYKGTVTKTFRITT